jgi:hypothetical protein
MEIWESSGAFVEQACGDFRSEDFDLFIIGVQQGSKGKYWIISAP